MLTGARRLSRRRPAGRPRGPAASCAGPTTPRPRSRELVAARRHGDQGLAERRGRPHARPTRSSSAICDAGAPSADLPVTAHAQGAGQVERALGAGVDELAHTPWIRRLSDDVDRAAAARLRIVSTLDIHSYGRDTPAIRDRARQPAPVPRGRRHGDLRDRPGQRPDPGRHPHARGAAARATPGSSRRRSCRRWSGAARPRRARGPDRAGRSPLDDPSAFDDLRLVVRAGRVVSAR